MLVKIQMPCFGGFPSRPRAILIAACTVAATAGACTSGPEKQPRQPSDWHWIQRTYPHYAFDHVAVQSAIQERHVQERFNKTATSWQFVGPTNIGGRIVDVEYDPRRAGIAYAAAATGGVFKTTDDGQNWSPIFDDYAVLTIGDIAVDPLHPETLFVGTGESNGGHNNAPGLGVYRSVNGGAEWHSVGLEATASIGRVAVDPFSTNRVFVAAIGSYFAPTQDRGLYRSLDHGESWERVLFVNDSTGVIDVAINPRSPDTVFAATWERVRRPAGDVFLYGAGSGVWRSTDGGDTWSRLSNGLPNPTTHTDATGRPRFGRIGLAVYPSNPNIIYALYINGQSNTYLGLYRSMDGGDTWSDADPLKRAGAAFADFSWYFGQVRVAPDDHNHVFVLDQSLAASRDGGQSWTIQSGTHVDHHAMAFDPDGGAILNGNDGGLAISRNGGETWARAGELPITQFYEIAVDPARPQSFLGGTQDNGTVRSGLSESSPWSQVLGSDGFYVAVDPDDHSRVYAETQYGGLYRIDEGGFNFIKPPGVSATNWSTPFRLHPEDPRVILYGARRVWRSNNRGDDWTSVSPLLGKNTTGRLGTITSLAISPVDTDVWYAGTDDGNIWATSNGGTSWTNRTAGLVHRWVTRVVPDPFVAGRVFASFSGLKWRDPEPHVFRSDDFGATWQPTAVGLPDSPVNALIASPTTPNLLFAGLDVGAYVSEDAGSSWTLLGTGMPAVSVYDLAFDTVGSQLIAGTHGRSMYSLSLSQWVTSTDSEDAVEPGLDVRAFPNPFSQSLQVEVDASAGVRVSVSVFDLEGRLIRRLADRVSQDGSARVKWDGLSDAGTPVANGMYAIRATTTSESAGGVVSATRLVHLVR